ncbi:1,4-alpha-glucan-branching enzyme 1, chloroplastic/amyloplastic-like [Macadamia integrifolia]|uniref:1,4-alpha-glucan-branching enzyme 1, chloroplastic/amyloplastic-like n=1 Tax=Macadamia integrifolia TaxID=60698 RepID=UPI001C4E9A23|nr:1,4-alpha-glucan-branching enzyme 1, chloroplastic/amyloplastic-like [Macadamia integrifolia]
MPLQQLQQTNFRLSLTHKTRSLVYSHCFFPSHQLRSLQTLDMAFTLSGIHLPTVPTACISNRTSIYSERKNVNFSLLLRKDSSPWKIFAGKSSHDSDSSSTATAIEKVLVPDGEADVSSSSADLVETSAAISEDSQVFQEVAGIPMEEDSKIQGEQNNISSEPGSHDSKVDGEQHSVPVQVIDGAAKDGLVEVSAPLEARESDGKSKARPRSIPPPGTGQKIYEIDPMLNDFRNHLDYRYGHYKKMRELIDKYEGGLEAFSCGYEKFGFNRSSLGVGGGLDARQHQGTWMPRSA